MAIGLFCLMFGMARLFPADRETTATGRLLQTALTAGLGLILAWISMASGSSARDIMIGGAIGFGVFFLVGGGRRR